MGKAHPVKLPQVAVWKPCTQAPVLCDVLPLSVTAVLVSVVLVSVVLVSARAARRIVGDSSGRNREQQSRA